ncbi:MAG: N-ethylammeline chlorohydrolase, partial [Spirochaetaceae bacterium]
MGESVRIYNASMIAEDGTLLQGIEIMVREGIIESVGPAVGKPAAGKDEPQAIRQYDAAGHLVYPGLINTHTHSAMTLFRSYADDLPLMEWLQKKIWPVEAHLDPEDVYWGTMLATVEMLRSGTTCCCDMYLHMQSAAEAFEASGMRAVVAQGLFSFLPDPAAALQESVEFCRRWNGAAGGRISTLLAPHAPYTCHAEYLKEIAAAGRSEGIGLHTHLSESKAEVEQSYAEHGV